MAERSRPNPEESAKEICQQTIQQALHEMTLGIVMDENGGTPQRRYTNALKRLNELENQTQS